MKTASAIPSWRLLAVGIAVLVPLSGRVVRAADDVRPASRVPGEAPRLVTSTGHSNIIASAAFSPDGRRALTGSWDKTARLWDVDSGELIRAFGGHTQTVTSAVFSPDGLRVLTGSWDRTARIWDARTGAELHRFAGHENHVTSVAFHPDGRQVLTGSWDGLARLWDAGTGRLLRVFRQRGALVDPIVLVNAVAFSPDGRRIVTGQNDATARLWDTESGELIQTFRGHTSLVNSVAFSPDGRQILTGSEDRTARLWDAETGRERRIFSEHTASVSSVAFSFDGRLLVTGSWDGTARLRETESGRTIQQFRSKNPTVSAVAISPDAGRVLTGAGEAAQVWGTERGEPIRAFRGHAAIVTSTAFSADGRRFLTGHSDRTARLWDMESGQPIRTFEGHGDPVSSVAFSPDGGRALTGSSDQTARLWDIESGREVRRFAGHTDMVLSVAFSPEGRRVLTGSEDRTARLWDPETGAQTLLLRGHDGPVSSVTFSPAGDRILTGSEDKTARLWDAGSGRVLRTLGDHGATVYSVAFSSDGRSVLTASWESAQLWDAGSGQLTRTFRLPGVAVYSAAFARGGTMIVTVGSDRSARLWDAELGREVSRFEQHSAAVTSLAVSPDGLNVLTGSNDQTARLWESGTARELCTLVSFEDRSWMVVDPEGRFDASRLESIVGLHWVFPDDPFRPLAPEIYLRDYFEPRLMPRLLDPREKGRLSRVRPLAGLNRVQPHVEIIEVKPDARDAMASVTVRVASASDTFGSGTAATRIRTSVYDLRLLRDGQLVGRWPEPAGLDAAAEPDPTSGDQMAAWRDANRIALGPDGKATRTFTVRLVHRQDPGDVQFTAYAFNEDRVKSTTAIATRRAPAAPLAGKPRAYLICMGVGATEGRGWDLAFAAADARLMADGLGKALTRAGRYEVVPVRLTSERAGDGPLATATATKAHLKAALALLAGRTVQDQFAALLPDGVEPRAATPDDLVVLSFSGHGYTDTRGALYLLPYDVGAGRQRVEDILPRCISTAELSAWLRDIDAGELAMVVDACHSAAAVQQAGFKPGPLGGRGLGQLAYDKGMRVLAASQADDVAVESASISHGLLTYSLVKDGLAQRRAAREGKITLGGLLTYAAGRVPGLYKEIVIGSVRNVGAVRPGAGQATPVQRPELFDYDRAKGEVLLEGGEGRRSRDPDAPN